MVVAPNHINAEAGPSHIPTPHPAPAPTPRWIDEGHIQLLDIIGTGAYGVVWRGIDSRCPTPVFRAIKTIRRSGLDARQKQFQRRELALHRRASGHPSIVTVDRIFNEGDNTYVVMDMGEGGDLFGMICEQKRYIGDDEFIRHVFLQLVDGISHIHSLGISHRDIKPENIVCSRDGEHVRICDFGLAAADLYSSEFGCGSSFYIAPESLGDWFPEAKSYPTRPGDVWSLGVILVNLVCGRNPWRIASPTDESFNAFLADPMFLRKILPVSLDCLDLLRRIFTLHPEERIGLPELRKRVEMLRSFTMSEDEVRAAHRAAAAAKSQAHAHSQAQVQVQVPHSLEVHEDVEEVDDYDEETFPYDVDVEVDETASMYTPGLMDDGSSSPPNRSRSSSSMGPSQPATPHMEAHDRVVDVPVSVSSKAHAAIGDVDGDEFQRFKAEPYRYACSKTISPSPDLTPVGRREYILRV